LNEIEPGVFINLITDEKTLKVVSLMLNSDFDICLIAGFGYVDVNVPKSSEIYEYGLFTVEGQGESDDLVATFNWEHGTSPTIDVPMQGAAKTNKSNKTVDLTWEVDVEKYKNYGILNGFNIFRKEMEGDFIKLNDKPIWVSLKEAKSTLYYRDINVDLEKGYVYAAAPNTIFNTNGSFNEIKVEPVVVIPEITPPKLSAPQYSTNKLQLNWEFDSSKEAFIKGFYIQKKQDQGNLFENISDLQPVNTRSFDFTNLPAANDNYYHFKVIAIKADGIELWSNRKIYYHKKETKPSVPQNLKGEINREGESIKLLLNWEKPTLNPEAITEYYLYTSHPNDEKVVKDSSLGKITAESTEYTIHKNSSARYYFAISAVNGNYEESPLSNKIEIVVPSMSLPFIDIWPLAQEGNAITLNWKYSNEIADLAGFRLFQNGELIANESTIDETNRQWVVTNLEPGKYSFEMMAISESGVESERSKPRTFEVK